MFSLVTLAILLTYFFKAPLGFDQCLSKGETKEACWKKLILDELEKHGVEASMETVARIYAQDPSFGPSCHSFGHLLGQETYTLFKTGKDFEISPQTSFCSYGFFHGFMEKLAGETGDFSQARDFCTYADKQISQNSPDATLQCFHGIGHGWVNVHDRPELWGSEAKIIKTSLDLCAKVSTEASELSRCATGVFNGIADISGQGLYGLKLDAADPLAVCRRQEEKFKDACYLSFNSVLLSSAKGSFPTAAKFIEAIPEDEYAIHAMINLAAIYGFTKLGLWDHQEIATLCRGLEVRLVKACIQGYGFSFLEHGEPGKEYVRAVSFCKSDFLSESEGEACLSYIYTYFAQWYEPKKAFAICDLYDDKNFCRQKVETGLKYKN